MASKKPRIAAISLGGHTNNFITLVDNLGNSPLIFQGTGLYEINKKFDDNSSNPRKNKSLTHLRRTRDAEINYLIDTIASAIAYYIHNANISTLVIGSNALVGKRKTPTTIPSLKASTYHTHCDRILQHKLITRLESMDIGNATVALVAETYTASCSFLDKEPVAKHITYLGKRTKSGFSSKNGTKINANVNTAFNIMRSYVKNDKHIYSPDVLTQSLHPQIVKPSLPWYDN